MTRYIKEYITLMKSEDEPHRPISFEEDISDHSYDGYELYGPPVLALNGRNYLVMQVLIKWAEKPEEEEE
jgi:hypothetical protein